MPTASQPSNFELRILLFLLLLAPPLRALDFPQTPPTEPALAARTFHLLEGFEMQLIAAEPLVTDPVALAYDEDGRAYVCEMNDYPYTDKTQHKHAQENPTDAAIGRVRLLTDTDGDGTFDKASVFAEGLSWPTGAACWKGGIFVTATPDVWYLKDTTGDGVADVRQRVFAGFKKLNVQAVMNNPIWGLDHRIYIAGGSNGGEIRRVPGSESVMPLPSGAKPLSIRRQDFSFDPSTGDVRLESGGARFGNSFDDWGNRFLCNIRNPCQHVVLPHRYLERNPGFTPSAVLHDCAESGDQLPVYRTSPVEPWREFRATRWVSEGSTLPKSELQGAGVVTSSSGITIYRGDAYPPEYRDFAFVADVAGNLFYRLKLEPEGATFTATQVDGRKNFCTSDDLWFRPVNFTNAPDGCLHICDMYREVIEHPWSIPDDIHAALDLLRGQDKGRLWRLSRTGILPVTSARGTGILPVTSAKGVPPASKSGTGILPVTSARGTGVPPVTGAEGVSPDKPTTRILANAPTADPTTRIQAPPPKPRSTPKLSQATTPDLVALLDHPNAWHRDTAQRLLFEKQDPQAISPLRQLIANGKTPQGRAAALWALQGITIPKAGPPLASWDEAELARPLINGSAPTSHPGALSALDLQRAIQDKHEQVVTQAVRVAEHCLPALAPAKQSTWPPQPDNLGNTPHLGIILEALLLNHGGASADFHRALLLSAAWEFHHENQLLADIALRRADDPWARAAILLASPRAPMFPGELMMLDAVTTPDQGPRATEESVATLLADTCRLFAQQGISLFRFASLSVPAAMDTDQHPEQAEAALLATLEGLHKAGTTLPAELASLARQRNAPDAPAWLQDSAELPAQLAALTESAAQALSDAAQPLTRRVVAAKLLAAKPLPEARTSLLACLAPDQPSDLQLAALEALNTYREPEVAAMLISAWPKLTPPLREKALLVLLSRTDRIPHLLDAMEAKLILPAQLSTASKAALLRQKSPQRQPRIAKLLTAASSNRSEVITRYAKVISTAAPSAAAAARGQKVYQTACAVCHRHGNEGKDLGPHLGTVKAWTAEQLLTNILDPNREVSPNFALYLIDTQDGRALSGLITSETEGNVTLKQADGSDLALQRREIKTLTTSGTSLMPEGLEAAITPEQMADLIAFLRQ